MAALHAAVAGRPPYHRSQQAAILPLVATSATIPACVAVVGSGRGTLHIATFVAVDANEQNILRPRGRAIYGTFTMLAVPNYVWKLTLGRQIARDVFVECCVLFQITTQ